MMTMPEDHSEANEIAQKIIAELEKTSSKDLSDSKEVAKILHLTDVHRAKKILQHIDKASSRTERNIGKRAVIEALLLSTWLQRLYFIIRSLIMGVINAGITFSFILYFGSLNIILGVILGIVGFISALAISRLFDVQIVKITRKIVVFLNSHSTVKNFIVNHF
jgi:hypothetical protein